jgi:hypothetical protein
MSRAYLIDPKLVSLWKDAARATSNGVVIPAGAGLPADATEYVLTRSHGAALAGRRLRSVDDAMSFLSGAAQDVKDAARDDLGSMERIAIPVVITDDSEDRDRDVVEPGGGDLAHYRENPVLLFGHNHSIPAIGNGFGTHPAGNQMRSVATFNPPDVDEFGNMIGRMFEERIMRALSIGFIPKEWVFESERGPLAMRYLAWELIEYSAVNVPSNRNALVQARGLGIDIAPALRVTERMLDEKRDDAVAETWRLIAPGRVFSLPALREETDRLGREATAKERRDAARAESTRGAITYASAHRRGTPVAARGAEWDGGAEVADADVDDLRVMCAWFDSDEPDAKSSYKLPHHRANVDHTLVWRGLTAAMGALLGARGGVDVPMADRRGVYAHLARHYRDDFGAEPPEFRTVDEAGEKAIADAPYPPDVIDWLGVAVSLGAVSGAEEFARAVRANIYGRSAEEQEARERDASASQASANAMLTEAERAEGESQESDRGDDNMDSEAQKREDATQQGTTAQPVDLERLISLAERVLA